MNILYRFLTVLVIFGGLLGSTLYSNYLHEREYEEIEAVRIEQQQIRDANFCNMFRKKYIDIVNSAEVCKHTNPEDFE